MIHPKDLPKIFAYGAELDAWAAVISRLLGQQAPAYQAELEKNRLDELTHARILSGLAQEEVDTSAGYSRMLGISATSFDPRWNAALLNMVERRSEIQFRLAWRLCRNGDLLQVAADEARHVKLGREILRSLVVCPTTLAKARDFMNEADRVCGTVDLEGLQNLNERVFQETVDYLFC